MIRELLDVDDLDALEREYAELFPMSRKIKERRFRHLRAAARFWLAAALNDEEAALDAPVADGKPRFSSFEGGADCMRLWVNEELMAFPLRLVSITDAGEPDEPKLPVDVLNVAALQLAQLIADGLTARRCANEMCGRGFVRQRSTRRKTTNRGDYAGTAHAVGVRYCSAECGKAQQAREHRRRKRAQKDPGA